MLLADGTGRPNPQLEPLREAILAMPRHRSASAWIRGPKARLLLRELAQGSLPLTHRAFHGHPEWRAAAHLRDLLMTCGLLPQADKYLLHYESWLHRRFNELHDQSHLPLLEQFVTWHQLPKLRSRVERRPLTPSTGMHAAQQFNRAHEFLTWLDEQGLALEAVGQAETDRWHATHPLHQQRALRAFLTWARDTSRIPRKLTFPRLAITEGQRLTQHRRLELLRRILDDNAGPPRSRAGRPLHPHSLAELIRNLGIPGRAVRAAALRQLVLQAPAPVIAQALGFHDKTTTQVLTEAGGSWNRYAPSDHAR